MEDGGVSLASQMNGDSTVAESIMANFPEIEVTRVKNKSDPASRLAPQDNAVKVNGGTGGADSNNKDISEPNSPDEDALVIDEDERPPKPRFKRKKLLPSPAFHGFKGFKRKEEDSLTNNYVPVHTAEGEAYLPLSPSTTTNSSTTDQQLLTASGATTPVVSKDVAISQQHSSSSSSPTNEPQLAPPPSQDHRQDQSVEKSLHQIRNNAAIRKVLYRKQLGGNKKNKKNPSPKLREYAQYLGLQPTVKFKCSKCEESNFQSLAALNDHHMQCLRQPLGSASNLTMATSVSTMSSTSNHQQTANNAMTSHQQQSSTQFRVTRKVYLCSACGTYYEIWNLFLHMREVHKRFICLYCLGMFSQPEKLSNHLVAKHNCQPGHHSSPEEFLQVYKEPCFLMCCDCERVFTEQENFYGHACTNNTAAVTSANVNNSNSNSANVPPTKQQKKQLAKSNVVNAMTVAAATPSPSSKKSSKKHHHVTADTEENEDHQECVEDDAKRLASATVDGDEEEDGSQHGQTDQNGDNGVAIKEEIPENEEESAPNEAPPLSQTDADEDAFNTNLDQNSQQERDEDDSETSAEEEQVDDISAKAAAATAAEEAEYMQNGSQDGDESESDLKLDEGDDELDDETSQNDDTVGTDTMAPAVTQEKVPPLTLKLPRKMLNNYSDLESDFDDSDYEKQNMDVDENSDVEVEAVPETEQGADAGDQQQNAEHEQAEEQEHQDLAEDPESTKQQEEEEEEAPETMPVAGEDVSVIELELEQPLDKFCIKMLLKKCLSSTVATCIYCNHARKIAVNGKQLGLHAIAEHRFSGTVNSITAEELIPESFNSRIKECLPELQTMYFNLEKDPSATPAEEIVPFDRMYECFQCRYVTAVHKELYLHNRKMHAKTILLCIMCQSNFFSYSELLCHLCPGSYVLASDLTFRCCLCSSCGTLPSAFRLMVHLRKKHHTCDVCLEHCHNQSKLSNHVWKHKLHHLCYRCSIAYRNKPDITKHLFWKHGTESVVCKKCLQKKWPHVYHFCIPPNAFVCEECTQSFTKAVSLKVHKRLHSNEFPHCCTEENCTQKFISKKLLLKHEFKHRESKTGEHLIVVDDEKMDLEEINVTDSVSVSSKKAPGPAVTAVAEAVDEAGTSGKDVENCSTSGKEATETAEADAEVAAVTETKEQKKVKIDVYDLPALNLSESDSSDSEDEKAKIAKDENGQGEKADGEPSGSMEDSEKSATVIDGVWDNFKSYQAAKAMQDGSTMPEDFKYEEKRLEELHSKTTIALLDHDYCTIPASPTKDIQNKFPGSPLDSSMDHDYCTMKDSGQEGKDQKPSEATPIVSLEDLVNKKSTVNSKKQKTPKKKKPDGGGSLSSSDSSSGDSDSSSCTCGSNCSCSSSSGSSSSSSSSSESESSSSEGRRRIAARRERRKQKALEKKKDSEGSQAVEVVVTDPMAVNPFEAMLLETDLDTDETETDEDFYDEHPQKLASKMLAEKRNQLMMGLVISNGTEFETSASRPPTPSLMTEVKIEDVSEERSSKKKAKSKKRKKKQRRQQEEQLQQQQMHHQMMLHQQHRQSSPHFSSSYYNHHHHVSSSPARVTSVTTPASVHSPVTSAASIVSKHVSESATTPLQQRLSIEGGGSSSVGGVGSGSDVEKRCSKRKRVRNKFYGYSSDEDGDTSAPVKPPPPPVLKWRKADLPSPSRRQQQQQQVIVEQQHHYPASPQQQYVPTITIKTIPSPAPLVEPLRTTVLRHTIKQPAQPDSDSEPEKGLKKSSGQSDTTDSDSDSETGAGQLMISTPLATSSSRFPQDGRHVAYGGGGVGVSGSVLPQDGSVPQRTVNLYCYCQCPYDEVSEMIACDGADCTIEWFHFECVGIMVPPKGKWFCPECRKKNTLKGEMVHA